ncbi:hypothetical protein [Enterovibrio baiacu]|uniref:hypothetical protein n=1 Tax=Enterovibrio baiacu TaxID=2491023 RepID=UPI001010ED97|nr:hypothetical protein [Enterovibrio baiacu]MBE1273595.1 hypothetical protein [Enterovibrio baiacu]
MRKHLSLVFFCLATVLILLQLLFSLMELTQDQRQHQILHVITRTIEKAPVMEAPTPHIDFKKMAQEMEQEKY